ncbi:MAG: ABC transporter substrate-binding protein, partial [Acidimicrobiia bacterium]|nr:ABC transporter substrate-binding protein [Acidimicrobiia bacterium]
MRRFMALVMATLVALIIAAPTATAQEEGVTLIIGLTQPWETLNPTIGFAVSEYEFWNIQYATLTSKAAEDYAPIPGLAESWVENDAGISYTYTLRDGLAWSDGTPLTAEDIVWNINTGRDQEWSNMLATVQNLTAEAVDDRTVTITSSVPDPKLPNMDVYIVPKHIWESVATDGEAVSTYEALDGVGSGPFTLVEYKSEEFIRMAANPNFYDGQVPIDELIFRYFSNPDAMVAALQQGEIDAATDIPPSAVETLEADPDIEMVAGFQGGFDEIATNGGKAEGQPHPAFSDIEFRQAISLGIDKAAAVEDLWFGLAEVATTISVGADLKWVPEIPADKSLEYDPQRAIEILDAGGYVDTDGDGIREMPGGGENIVIKHAVNTDSDLAPAIGELFSGWMNAIGIGVELDSYDQNQLIDVIYEGTYDTFYWGWVPFVDPDPMLSYFTAAELGNWNDANWSNDTFDQLYAEQNQEVDPDRRLEIVHEMLTILYDDAVYFPLWYAPDLQAYRTDRFEGWVRQPADIGPVIFSQSSPSYA